jgi:hyperosmotically inducible protein
MFSLMKALLIAVLVVVLVAVAGAFFLGYRTGDRPGTATAVGTSGDAVSTEAARERGAAIGEKVADVANAAQDAISDGAITAKIKSKMALDDTIKARDIRVSTTDGAVTLSGKVGSTAERDRALQLARETDGVKSVADRLEVAK